jgi:hypothetical protein
LAHGTGNLIACRLNLHIEQLNASGFTWLAVLVPQGIQVAALAAESTQWSLGPAGGLPVLDAQLT